MDRANDQLLHHVELQTQDVSLTTDNHSEHISFLIIHSPHYPVVLGFLWLEKHNLQLDWKTGRILQWTTSCLASCLHSAPWIPEPEGSDDPVFPDISKVPKEYLDLKEVFNKAKVTSLPPCRPMIVP